ncbi:MAG: response regulator [Planctomycetes bacterium]|nr:response regulator [Planctomycetota bacterium]
MKTVLVVDDEPLIRWSLREGLKDQFRILAAAGVTEALCLLAREPVDAVLTDLKMPDGNGMELVEYLRRHRPSTRVFVITALGSSDTVERCLQLNVHGYIRKPFDLRLIRDMIQMSAVSPQR